MKTNGKAADYVTNVPGAKNAVVEVHGEATGGAGRRSLDSPFVGTPKTRKEQPLAKCGEFRV